MDKERLVPRQLLAHARILRHGQSTPEAVLWRLLRGRHFSGLKFRRQHPIGPFITDFYCADLHWVIEVDGGQHNTAEAKAYDERRTGYIAGQGVTVTRFWSDEVMERREAVIQQMENIARRLAAERGMGTLTPALSHREREE